MVKIVAGSNFRVPGSGLALSQSSSLQVSQSPSLQVSQSPSLRVSQSLSYSYLSASIGSNLAALTAGIKPEAKLTSKHNVTPPTIQFHGTIKALPISKEIPFPAKIPKIMPNNPPS